MKAPDNSTSRLRVSDTLNTAYDHRRLSHSSFITNTQTECKKRQPTNNV